MQHLVLALIVGICVILSGCKEPRESWVKALKECGVTDINSDKILYFGPSNKVGPGSTWRETFDESGKHVDYRLRWVEADFPPPKDFLQLAEDSAYQCKNGKRVSFSLSTSAAASLAAFPLSAELSNDFQKAKKVNIAVGGMSWDQVKEGPYVEYFKQTLGPRNPIYEDMSAANRLVLYRALAVKNLIVDYEFSAEDAAALKAKYNGPLSGTGVGNIGAELSATWKNTNTLSITAPGKSWVLGELGKFQSMSGFAGGTVVSFQPVDIPAATILRVERQN